MSNAQDEREAGRALLSGPDRQAEKEDFARKLKEAMAKRGWRSGDLMRAANQFLVGEQRLTHAHMSHYINARSLPRQRILHALSRALDGELTVGVVLPTDETLDRAAPPEAVRGGGILLEDAGQGIAHIQLDVWLPWPIAVKVLELIKVQAS